MTLRCVGDLDYGRLMISAVIWIGLQACTYLWTSQLGPQAVQAEACSSTRASHERVLSPGRRLLQEEGESS